MFIPVDMVDIATTFDLWDKRLSHCFVNSYVLEYTSRFTKTDV